MRKDINMNICLLGGTGRVGKHILKRAIADEHHVTALVRSSEKLTDVTSKYLTIIEGNVLNELDIVKSIKGADIVVSALGTDKNDTLSKSMPLIIKAMQQQQISRIITIGTAGILDSRTQPERYRFQSNESKRRITTAAEDHLKAYKQLAASDVSWTIVCPTYLPDEREIGKYRVEKNRLPEDGRKISVADTAAFSYQQLFDDSYIHTRVGIAY